MLTLKTSYSVGVWGDAVMKKSLSPQDVISQYVESGVVLTETTLNGDYRKGNKEGEKLIKVFKSLENDLELANNSLSTLLRNENIVTRTKAAAHCLSLKINIEQSLEVLELAADDVNNGVFGFNAKMTLQVWHEQGFLRVYPDQKLS